MSIHLNSAGPPKHERRRGEPLSDCRMVISGKPLLYEQLSCHRPISSRQYPEHIKYNNIRFFIDSWINQATGRWSPNQSIIGWNESLRWRPAWSVVHIFPGRVDEAACWFNIEDWWI